MFPGRDLFVAVAAAMEGRQPFVLGNAAVSSSGSGSGGGSGDGIGRSQPGLPGPSDRGRGRGRGRSHDRTSVPAPAPTDASASSRNGGVTAPLSVVPDRSVQNTAQETATVTVKAAVKATTLLPLAVESASLPPLAKMPANSSSLSPSPSPKPTATATATSTSTDNGSGSGSGSGDGNLRPAATLRAVTPEPAEVTLSMSAKSSSGNANTAALPHRPGPFPSTSPETSPRSILGAGGPVMSKTAPAPIPVGTSPGNPSGPVPTATPSSLPTRRQGMVFGEAMGGSLDSASSSPPSRPSLSNFRPRTHTLDSAFRQQLVIENRHRVGSVSSSGSVAVVDDSRPLLHNSYGPSDNHHIAAASGHKERKSSTARTRLTKKSAASQPSSPFSSPQPSLDSLPLPVPTRDANKVLLLMKNLCGRMRGEAQYLREIGGPWHGGTCYIDEEKGSLVSDSGEGSSSSHSLLIPDLRACRVLPLTRMERGGRPSLEITSPHLNLSIILRPSAVEEYDMWLAAFLCWQQMRPSGTKNAITRSGSSVALPPLRSEMQRRASSSGLREATVIKVGRVMLWDKGLATSPRAIVKRPSARDLRIPHMAWKRVSCILFENGELKLMAEHDVSLLAMIELSQLSRSAIQQLDKTVLNENYCIGIFPIYSSTSTQLSILRPVYISLESRVFFEAWFALLRAFAVPDIYGLDPTSRVYEVTNLNAAPKGEVFRVEKTIKVRVTEARLRSRTFPQEGNLVERQGKNIAELDPVVGNYFAEVILDGEVRGRTSAKSNTKNPFWREDCEFTDLPPSLPHLSVVLKRIVGNTESFSHQLQATLGLPKAGQLSEVLCGAVDISLHLLERGKDHEQWLQVYDARQQSIGTILLKVHHEEVIVLQSKEYQPLSELLHRFTSGLTTQIAEVMPGNLRKLAELFVNIFQVSGKATEWLATLVEEEIDAVGNQTASKKSRFNQRLMSNDSIGSNDKRSTVEHMERTLPGEASLLFRGNSLLTQAFELYMRRLGKEYLEETLAEKIREINELDLDCEVDPGRVQNGDDIQQHWAKLIEQTGAVWRCIASSAHRLPPEIRHVLKYIRAVAEDRYGHYYRTAATVYTSVSGFLFLRFICPAILNPKLFGLLRDHPKPRAQRTLTLIAKSIQALANLNIATKKEAWMEPMNEFLQKQRQPFKDFADAVCAIPAEKTNTSVPAPYSTPLTILGRLSPLAREGFPSLPYLVDHARNFAALAKLWAKIHPESDWDSSNCEGDLLQFHRLCTTLHQRATHCFSQMETRRDAGETTSKPSDERLRLSDALDNFSYGDVLGMSAHNNATGTFWIDGDSIAPGSSGSEVDGPVMRGGGGGDSSSSTSISSRDIRNASSAIRQGSKSSDQLSSMGMSGGTVKGLRNGMQAPRKFLTGFIRKTRTASPEFGTGGSTGHGFITGPLVPETGSRSAVASSSATAAGKENGRERDRGAEREKESKEKHRGAEREKDSKEMHASKDAKTSSESQGDRHQTGVRQHWHEKGI
ncbi:hypothetical protein QBC45DRAFT_227750 [Copromyces sp. CBS 386.78]|nr:hypothetical protein QBC45DRAFT_227750 [Copromyces sp. CBS 386.78]